MHAEKDGSLVVSYNSVVAGAGRWRLLNESLAPVAQLPAPPPVLPEDPQRPIAICFTSGSTGAPKGALFRDWNPDTDEA